MYCTRAFIIHTVFEHQSILISLFCLQMPTKKDESPTKDGNDNNSTEAANEDSAAGDDVIMDNAATSESGSADHESNAPGSSSPDDGEDGKTNGKSGLTPPPPTQINKFKLSGGPAANVIKKERRQSSSR